MKKRKNRIAGIISLLVLSGIIIFLLMNQWKAEAVDQIPEAELELLLPEEIDDLVLKRNTACFAYEELPDGTLRITGYDEGKNTKNPYQVMIPSVIDGKRVSTLGKECLGVFYAGELVELTVSDGITTIEESVIEYAYQYAKENGYAFQVMEAALPENDFLDGYRKGTITGIPYFAHIKAEGEKYDYITIDMLPGRSGQDAIGKA